MKILMTGVDENRFGGMWTVANNYICNSKYNKEVDLTYVATSTNGSIIKRTCLMLKAFIKIKSILSKKQTDIVHIHMAEKGSTFRARIITKIAKKYNVKVVIHLHAGPFMDWYSTLNEKKKNQIKELFDLSDKVLVLGNFWKEQLAALVKKNKIEVLYNGVKVPSSNKYNINGKYITFMGVLKKTKGIYDLIDAIKLIDKELPKNIIVKVCGIDLEGNVQEYINSHNLEKRIELAGWVDEKKRKTIYANTVINVLPSYYEALSMTVIESMANGIPIITTNISTMNEMLDDKELLIDTGNVKELSEKLLLFINSQSKRKNVSKRIYKRAKELFSEEEMINNTLKIYSKVASK